MKLRIVIDVDMPGTQSMDTVAEIQRALFTTTDQLCGAVGNKWSVVVTSGEEGGDQQHCFYCGGCVIKTHKHPGMCCCPTAKGEKG